MSDPLSGIVVPGTPVVIEMPRPKNDRHIQIDAPGSNVLSVATQVSDAATPVTQTTLTAETKVIDMIDVKILTLTATGGNMEYAVISYRNQ